MADLDPSKPKPPYNPYYLGAYYMLFQLGLAIIISTSSSTVFYYPYQLIHISGFEELILMIPALNRVHHYLLGEHNPDRWNLIAVYFSIFILTYLPMMAVVLCHAKKYLFWISQQDETWKRPIAQLGKKGIKYGKYFAAALIIASCYELILGPMNMANPGRHSLSFQVHDWGFFSFIFDAAAFFCAIIILQAVRYREASNSKLEATLQTKTPSHNNEVDHD